MPDESAAPDPSASLPVAPSVPKLQSLDALLGIVLPPKTIRFEFAGQLIDIDVRPLTSVEWAEINKIGADLQPPPKLDAKKQPIPGEVDKEDKGYLDAAVNYHKLRRMAAFGLALPGFEFPGHNLEEKLKWVEEKLPPNLVSMLWSAISSLSSDPIQLAHFTTVAR